MKIISYKKTKLLLDHLTEEELLVKLDLLIKTKLEPTEFGFIPNPKKYYIGDINKNNKSFSIQKNMGGIAPGKYSFAIAKGKYRVLPNQVELEITYRIEYYWLFILIIPLFGYAFGSNFIGPIAISTFLYAIFFFIPFNATCIDMQANVIELFRGFIIQKVDLTPKFLRL